MSEMKRIHTDMIFARHLKSDISQLSNRDYETPFALKKQPLFLDEVNAIFQRKLKPFSEKISAKMAEIAISRES